jgi:dihydrofolate reductase
MKPLALIVAVSRNGVIGNKGALPWHLPEDLKWFRKHTTGHAVIMGRKTYDSIGRPLPNRRMLVVSRTKAAIEGCETFATFESALEAARTTDPMPFVIGGAALYALALPLATHLYLTRIERDVEGDTHFTSWNAEEWVETAQTTSQDGAATFCILERKR